MLVLKRKAEEAIWIGNARVVITQAENGTARVGIFAPQEIEIVREELLAEDDPRLKLQTRKFATA